MSEFLKFAFDEVLGEGAEGLSPYVTGAVAAFHGLQAVISDFEKSVRDRARRVIDCVHVEVCEGSGPPIADMVATAFTKKGCAFSYGAVALWHFQSNLDVHRLSARPIRYDKQSNRVGYYSVAVQRCRSCHP